MKNLNEYPTPLSDRIRPDTEAAPWVCAEVKLLEQRLAACQEALSWYANFNNWGYHDCPTDANGDNFTGMHIAKKALALTASNP